MQRRRDLMQLDEDKVIAEFKSRKFAGIREYTTSSKSCTCSWYQIRLFCKIRSSFNSK